MGIISSIRHAWNVFRSRDPTRINTQSTGQGYSRNPDKVRMTISNERSIINSIYNRIAIDCAAITIHHVRVNENGKFTDVIDDDLNQCLTVSPNLDQTPRAFFQDIYLSALDEGYIAIIIADADMDPIDTGTYKIREIRRGRIREWYPKDILVEAYNPETGRMQNIVVPKAITVIVENPLYSVTNGPNSTLQRLIHKLNILDAIDKQSSSGKMDMIIQLPYLLRSERHKNEAEERRKMIEMQLTDSKYGIAYIDATEKITQLNRPIENNLLNQIEYLHETLYSQLGLTKGVMDGTASEAEILNYNSRTIDPFVSAVASDMHRKWLTKTARSQGQAIQYFSDPFKLVPVSQIAEIADKFTRNEILSSNEIRGIMGFKPSNDPKANELRNSNIAQSKQESAEMSSTPDGSDLFEGSEDG